VGKILNLIKKEEARQKETLMMIPSENYTYPEVRRAVGSVLMHKYAEGQPYKRYYQGNETVDEIEMLAKKYALEAFGLEADKWSANVQPHSGSEANLAIYNALLNPGEKILSMHLTDGGHLSHGWEYKGKKLTLVSKIYEVDFYHVDAASGFDYKKLEKQALKFRPRLIISGGTAYPREINHTKMRAIAKKVGAYYLADISHEAGLIAGKANTHFGDMPDVVMFTTHKTLRGPRGAVILSKKEFSGAIDASVFPGLQGGPHTHTIAGIALTLKTANTPKFINYAQNVVANAQALSEELTKYGFSLVSGGTQKHLILIDLRNKNTNGWFAALALEKSGIVVNKNTIPGETGSPYYPNGLRLGTPALTARGMGVGEMKKIAGFINEVVEHIGPRNIPADPDERQLVLSKFKGEISNDKTLLKIQSEVKKLCLRFPVI